MIRRFQSLELFGKDIFQRALIEPPLRLPAPMPNDACFFYMIRGGSRIVMPEGNVDLDQQTGVFLRCGYYFNDYLRQSDNEPVEAIAIHFHPGMMEMIYDREFPEFLGQVERVEPLAHFSIPASAALRNYIHGLITYFEHPELTSEEILKLKLRELILLLVQTDTTGQLKTFLLSLLKPRDLDFRRVIDTHATGNLSVDELAQLCFMSRSSFKRKFAEIYEVPPARYLRERRLERGAHLLRTTGRPIAEIAFESGFKTAAHFSRLFKNQYGQSPRAYRLDQTEHSGN